jgi:hypothetical protein
MFYVIRPVSEDGRLALNTWAAGETKLDWSVDGEGDDLALSLHGCDLVRDWERQSGWKLPEESRSALYDDMAALFARVPGGLELTATWTDDPVDQAIDLSRPELLTRVLANQIANRTTYRIASGEGGRLT